MIPSHLASRVFSVLLFFVPTGYSATLHVSKTGFFLFLVVSKSHDEFPFWFWVVIQEREKL